MFDPDHSSAFHDPLKLRDRLARAPRMTPELMQAAVDRLSAGVDAQPSGWTRVQRLVGAEAWADAALALLACGLPGWTIRRLAHDGSCWHCDLSRQPMVPDWLDDMVAGSGADLPVAILDALIQARNIPGHALVARNPNADVVAVLADNFS